jgi:outer membrane protein TolC
VAASAFGDSAAPVVLSGDFVAQRALAVSPALRAARAGVGAAQANVDAAKFRFAPRTTLEARYTRLSNFTPVPLMPAADGRIVGTNSPAGTINPPLTMAVDLPAISLPVVLDNWALQASVLVPVSDYALRIRSALLVARSQHDVAAFDAARTRATVIGDALAVYYGWLRARELTVAAKTALESHRAHERDAKVAVAQGVAASVDVLRAQTAVANAEQLVLEADREVEVLDAQLRFLLGLESAGRFESLATLPMPTDPAPLADAEREATDRRADLRSIRAQIATLRHAASAAGADRIPQLALAGNATYANPNTRRIPLQPEWFPTWDASVVVRYSIDDAVSAGARVAEREAQAAALEAKLDGATRALRVELTEARASLVTARARIALADRAFETATEAHRIVKLLYKEGKAAGVLALDAETDRVRARVATVEARIGAQVAALRFDVARGRFDGRRDDGPPAASQGR